MKAFFNSLKKPKDGKGGEGSSAAGGGPDVVEGDGLDKPPEVYTNANAHDFLARYEVGATVGVGGFAVVKKARDKETNEQLAVKIVDRSRYSAGDNSLAREIEVLTKINHPNCIKLYAVYLTERKVYIVTELVDGGELLDRVTEKGNYSEPEAAVLFSQILEGVWYLHQHGIVHRDLKLENLIMQVGLHFLCRRLNSVYATCYLSSIALEVLIVNSLSSLPFVGAVACSCPWSLFTRPPPVIIFFWFSLPPALTSFSLLC